MATVQEMPKSTTDRNTGFPEPLSPDRNTTLPHPEADTHHAVIEGAALQRTHSRSRSFRRHQSNKLSNSSINKHTEGNPTNPTVQHVNGLEEKRSPNQTKVDARNGHHEAQSTTDSVGSRDGSEGEEVDISQLTQEERDETGYKEGERRKGVLRKMRLHKA